MAAKAESIILISGFGKAGIPSCTVVDFDIALRKNRKI